MPLSLTDTNQGKTTVTKFLSNFQTRIIRDLSAGPSTADALADRLRVAEVVLHRELEAMAQKSLVASYPLENMPELIVWRII